MRVKASMHFVFEDSSWSELVYFTVSDFAAARLRMTNVMKSRVRCLSNGAVLRKLRLKDIDSRGLGQLFVINLVGLGGDADTPWQAVGIYFNSADGARRKYKVTGIPDFFTRKGHFVGDGVVTTGDTGNGVIGRFANELVLAQAQIAYYDRAQLTRDVGSIDATGNVLVLQDLTVAAGDTIQFYKTVFAGSREAVKGRWRVDTVTDARHFKVLHWPAGRTVEIGRVFKILPRLTNMASGFTIGDTLARRTGRPSGRQVGRRSSRR